MRILITGSITASVWPMAERLQKDLYEVSILGSPILNAPKARKITLYDTVPNHPNAEKIYRTGRFDAVIFLYGVNSENDRLGSALDRLLQCTQMLEKAGLKNFILISSDRVFGAGQTMREEELPMPDTRVGSLIKAAEDCLLQYDVSSMKLLLVRIGSLYANALHGSLFERARLCTAEKRPLCIDGTAESICDPIHAEDIGSFLSAACDVQLEGVAHLRGSSPCTYDQLMHILQESLPTLRAIYTGPNGPSDALITGVARSKLDWIPRHNWREELVEIFPADIQYKPTQNKTQRLWHRVNSLFNRIIPWLELCTGGALMEWLMSLSRVYAEYRFIDYRLLFVVLMGASHGMTVGVCAAVIACLSSAYGWMIEGNSAWMLLYNADNWLPFAAYMLAGALFGYTRNKEQAKAAFIQDEMQQSKDECAFLQNMYEEACVSRDVLREQVMRYRDSYGRIYHIASELDSLQPAQIFFSALGVLEETMNNHSIAIYTLGEESNFARLAMCSREVNTMLDKSIELQKYPVLMEAIQAQTVFANHALLADHPSFCVPLYQSGKCFSLIMLWKASFEQQSLYYQNLFSVVAGLAQSSLVRASQFFDAVSGSLYEEGTRIMTVAA
ncbi:MAG: hypothetical protein RR482_03390, partial [Clostridia bacterium]